MNETTEPDLRFLRVKLSARLDAENVRAIIHYLAQRLGQTSGNRVMSFELRDGFVRQSRFNRGPVKNPELEAMGSREAL